MIETNKDTLLNFVANLTGNQYLKIEEDLGQGFVRLNISEAERRQAKHDIRSVEDIVLEMIRNSRDAGAIKVFIASTKEDNQKRKLSIIDDGDGVPAELQDKIFEPRVTSKLEKVITDRYGIHGRGMALFSIRQVADEIELVNSASGRGSAFKLQVSANLLSERKDQSTYPTIKYRKGKPIIIRGPHNIVRTVLELNLEHQYLEIYLGSPAEILATMCYLNEIETDSAGAGEGDGFKIWRCVGFAKSATDLSSIAEEYLGLRVSLRSTQRIMSGRVVPLNTMIERYATQETRRGVEKKAVDLFKPEPLARRISRDDLGRLATLISNDIEAIGAKYFLELSEYPEIQVDEDCLNITIKLQSKGN